jgi:hypothetical protein
MLDPLSMADHVSFTDDISTLWGPEGEGGLTPAPPAHPAAEDEGPAEPAVTNGHGNGNGTRIAVVEQDTREDVARLVHALAGNRSDIVQRSDLDAVRTQLEGAFTHQIAVALYELLAASNARFATAEDHINARVNDAVALHTRQLAASMDKQHRATTELSEFIWAELDLMRQRLNGPLDGLVTFQRELRHEVGRLGDVLAANTVELTREVKEESERQAAAGIELTERVKRSEEQAEAATSEVGELAGTLDAVRNDVAALREEVSELRRTLDGIARRQRGSRRRRRAG